MHHHLLSVILMNQCLFALLIWIMIFWIPKTVLLMQKALLIWSGQCFHKIIHMLHFHRENYHLFSFLEMIVCIEKLSRHHFSEYLLPASEVMMNVQCTPQKGAQQKET